MPTGQVRANPRQGGQPATRARKARTGKWRSSIGSIAQWLGPQTSEPKVPGSNPGGCSFTGSSHASLRRHPHAALPSGGAQLGHCRCGERRSGRLAKERARTRTLPTYGPNALDLGALPVDSGRVGGAPRGVGDPSLRAVAKGAPAVRVLPVGVPTVRVAAVARRTLGGDAGKGGRALGGHVQRVPDCPRGVGTLRSAVGAAPPGWVHPHRVGSSGTANPPRNGPT